eukprot:TRINITY_DN175_c0_g1_i2.p1 TRINITY_DN175_c0_g1~~TRINITY_DN175_c0_g1_i2.p1  ORF type:complete len:541 (+),score=187.84 TRINITY_DN175_c0_g1_i2:83-1705(+)
MPPAQLQALVGWVQGLPPSRRIPVLILAGVVLRTLWSWLLRKIQRRPPQPFALPVLGNLYLLPQPGELPGVHKVMTKLARTYGPVMGFWFGSQYTVVLSNWQAAHEALKTRGDAFAGRFCPESLEIITKGRGIAMQSNLEEWRKARTALLRGMTMKRQGERTVPVIMEEVHSTGCTIRQLCQQQGGAAVLKMRGHIGRESLNVYMRQMCNVRFSDRLTATYEDVRRCLEEIFKRISAGNPGDYMPIVRALAGKPKVIEEMEFWADRMYSYIKRWIAEHKATFKPEATRDFLDEMLLHQKETELTDTDIEVIMWDVMAGGIDTTSTTLEWLIYILCNYPETQRKIQEELEREVGPDRLPSYDDRESLPYTNAVILELMRWKHFAPFGLPHGTLEDTECLGYKIPKGSQVIINFHASGMDPSSWKRPEEWRPERWLEEEKDLQHSFLDGEVKKTEESYKFIPFGAGKRMCVGYGLGRVVLWLKVATHLHCFSFASGTGRPLNITDEHFGVTVVPEEQPVKVTPRPAARLLQSVEKTFQGSTL